MLWAVATLPRQRAGLFIGLDLQVHFRLAGCVSERGTAAAIDGRRLLLTPLRHALVPPPLCAAELRVPAPACCIALRDHSSAEVLTALPFVSVA